MIRTRTSGFTIVELIVAIVILSIGVLALGSGAMMSTRNLHRSRLATLAATQAQGKLDELLSYAASSAVPCANNATFKSSVTPVTTSQVTLSWNVPATGTLRTVRVFARYRLAGSGLRTDTLVASVAC
jgi:prepilin-type N-terminal cleavage/methylation domain-containing protein